MINASKRTYEFTILPTGATTRDDGQGPLIVAAAELLHTGLVQVCPLQRQTKLNRRIAFPSYLEGVTLQQ